MSFGFSCARSIWVQLVPSCQAPGPEPKPPHEGWPIRGADIGVSDASARSMLQIKHVVIQTHLFPQSPFLRFREFQNSKWGSSGNSGEFILGSHNRDAHFRGIPGNEFWGPKDKMLVSVAFRGIKNENGFACNSNVF